MSTTSDFLLADSRAALRRRASEDSRTEISRAFAAWLQGDTGPRSAMAALVRDAATRECAQQDFHTVAILGFGADAGLLTGNEIEVLKKGLRRQAGRGVVIDDLPAAFCSDAVGLFGVAVGTKAVADTELAAEVVRWISKFLKKSYGAERTEDWERCLYAAADRQLGNVLDLPIPSSPTTADVRAALATKGVIESAPGDQSVRQTLNLAMRELPDELSHDRAALRLAAVESVIEAAVPAIGGDGAVRSTKRHRLLSDRDQRLHDAIGPERFRTLTNAEIMKEAGPKKVLHAEGLDAGTDAAKSCLDRIRKSEGYPLSRDVVKKRSKPQ